MAKPTSALPPKLYAAPIPVTQRMLLEAANTLLSKNKVKLLKKLLTKRPGPIHDVRRVAFDLFPTDPQLRRRLIEHPWALKVPPAERPTINRARFLQAFMAGRLEPQSA